LTGKQRNFRYLNDVPILVTFTGVPTRFTNVNSRRRLQSAQRGCERFRGETRIKPSHWEGPSTPLGGGPSSIVGQMEAPVTQEGIAAVRMHAELVRRTSREAPQGDAKELSLEIASIRDGDADHRESDEGNTPIAVTTDSRGKECALALMYIAAAPLLLFAMTMTILMSKITSALFGYDPVASLLERLHGEWAILALTARFTLGLMLVGSGSVGHLNCADCSP
jgi:hypothetical protein